MQRVIDELRKVVSGSGLVTDPDLARTLQTDERGLYHGRAAAIVRPRTPQELACAVKICFDARVAMVPQGGNTGYCGGATPDGSGTQVLFNLSRMNRIRKVDELAMTLTADAGVLLADAQTAAAEHDLLFPLAMGSQGSCQLGGNISTNAGGLAVLRYGTARDLVAGLEVVLPDGRQMTDMQGLRKDNTGYDLKQLFIGAEGTLGFITGAVMRLHPMPLEHLTAWLGIRSIEDALEVLRCVRSRLGECICSIEYIAHDAFGLVLQNVPECVDPSPAHGGDYMLIELEAFTSPEQLRAEFEAALADAMAAGFIGDAVVAQNEMQRRQFWHIRESIPQAEKRAGGSTKHDISVALGTLAEFVQACRAGLAREFPEARLSLYGHVGDGNLHCNVLAPLHEDGEPYRAKYARGISELVHGLAAAFDGSFSAEHGVGQLKRELLASTAQPLDLELMRGLKRMLDPYQLMNPGKVL